MVRSAVAYGAAGFHTPTSREGLARGIATKLAPLQATCLRRVAGAYKAMPRRALETETLVPPLDLHLNQRLAAFEARLKSSGIARAIRDACAGIKRRLRTRGRGRPIRERPQRNNGEELAQWHRE